MTKKHTREYRYEIIKDPDIKHIDIVDVLAEVYDVEVIGDKIDEESSYTSVKLIIRNNGLKRAVQRAKEDHSS